MTRHAVPVRLYRDGQLGAQGRARREFADRQQKTVAVHGVRIGSSPFSHFWYCSGMDSRDALIEELRQIVAQQAAQLKQQADRIAQLELELAKAKKDSST
jgi:hypothetical protein